MQWRYKREKKGAIMAMLDAGYQGISPERARGIHIFFVGM